MSSSSSDEIMSSEEEEKIKKSRLSKASSSEEAEQDEEEDETNENENAASSTNDFRQFTQTQSDDDEDEEEHEGEENASQGSDKAETDRLKVKSDSEAEPSPTQEDLFGDADDVSTTSKEDDEIKSAKEINERQNSFAVDDDQEEVEEVPETLIDVEIPKINVDLGNQIHFVKFPNFLGVEPRPFDADTYEDEIDDDDVLDEEGRSRVKLKVENTIRWKNSVDDEGNPLKKSNAKIVRWSDGSMSLYLGQEVFDVHMHPLQGDHHHLFIRQGTGLQGRAIFRTKLTFRPHSTESFTHRKMTMSMADRTSKTQKVKVLPVVGKDPEAQKLELLKKEEERLRASARRESQQRRNRDRAHGRGLSASYLEPDRGESDEEENSVSLSAIKRSFKSGAREYAKNLYDSDDGSDVSDTKAKEKLEQAKRLDSDDDEQGSPSGEDKKKQRRANMIEEDSEDDD